MRRQDREVTDKNEIFEILSGFNTLRIGLQGEDYPYVVPVSFGVEKLDDKIVIYFHSAKTGFKNQLIEKNPNVCIEGDDFFKVEKTEFGITTRYQSVIGFGKCLVVESQTEILKALELLTARYGYADYPLDRCKGLEHVRVYKIIIDSLTAKRNLPKI